MATRSRIKEMADAEADLAEAEHPDDDDDDTDTDGDEVAPDEAAADPDAEPADEPAELSMEARAELMETALRLHYDNMAGFFGAEWEQMEQCPLCNGIGATGPESPALDPDTMQCPKCHGHGQLVTEAANPMKVLRQCPQCLGECVVPRVDYTPAPPTLMPVQYGQPPTPPATVSTATQTIPPMPVFDAQANVWRDPTTGAELAAVAPNGQSSSAPAPVPA